MNNTFFQVTTATRFVKLLLFPVGSLTVAFSIETVQKVINYQPIQSSGTGFTGIIHLENREITVLDLHKRLFKVSKPAESGSHKYLLLAKNSLGEQFGIVVEQTPTLLDIPTTQIRVLPESYRRADTLSIASHVTIIPQGETSLTVFILDADQLVPPIKLR